MSDIDDEFEKLIADFEMGSGEEPESAESANLADSVESGGFANQEGIESDSEIDLDSPEDESLHLAGGKHSVGLVLAPIAPAKSVSDLLALYGVSRWVVPIAGQVALWFEITEDDDFEFDTLLGDERPLPEECDAYARVMSRLSKFGAVAVVSALTEEERIINGDVIARRYVNGEPEEPIPAGLLVNWMDPRAEDLLLGRTHPSDYPEAIPPDNSGGKPVPGRGRPMRPGQ
ncbi:MAG: hypothetical protein Q4P05_05605 [Actinomycetaceae bacterium]|nr:hypothetical protein [Actinomycetaceae bacterium]